MDILFLLLLLLLVSVTGFYHMITSSGCNFLNSHTCFVEYTIFLVFFGWWSLNIRYKCCIIVFFYYYFKIKEHTHTHRQLSSVDVAVCSMYSLFMYRTISQVNVDYHLLLFHEYSMLWSWYYNALQLKQSLTVKFKTSTWIFIYMNHFYIKTSILVSFLDYYFDEHRSQRLLIHHCCWLTSWPTGLPWSMVFFFSMFCFVFFYFSLKYVSKPKFISIQQEDLPKDVLSLFFLIKISLSLSWISNGDPKRSVCNVIVFFPFKCITPQTYPHATIHIGITSEILGSGKG